MGLSRSYRFRDKRRFQPKIANFPTHLTPPLSVFPLAFGNTAEGRKGHEKCRPRKKSDDIFSRFDDILGQTWQTIRRTDRQSDTGRQQVPRFILYIHSVAR